MMSNVKASLEALVGEHVDVPVIDPVFPTMRHMTDARGHLSEKTATICRDPSLTQQQFAQESDPNYIIDRHMRGVDISLNLRVPYEGDFSDVPASYQEALNMTVYARQEFEKLPAELRAKFANDPFKFMDYVNDPKNEAELVDLGIRIERSAPDTSLKDVVDAIGKAAPKPPKKSSVRSSNEDLDGDMGEGS